jgi:hypothetical protein
MNAASQISLKVEGFKDGLSYAREVTKRCADWHALNKLPLTERYLKGKLSLGLRVIGGDFGNWGIIFQSNGLAHPDEAVASKSGDRCGDGVRPGLDKPSVFANTVKMVKVEEKIIPSSVRIERFDDLSLLGGQPLPIFTFYPLKRVNEVVKAMEEGKMFFRSRLAVATGQARGKDVQASSDAVNDGADLSVDNSRHWPQLFEFDDLFSAVSVDLYRQAIGATLGPIGNSRFQAIEVGFGPINCCLGV